MNVRLSLIMLAIFSLLPGLVQAAELLMPGDPILAIDVDLVSQSAYPNGEEPFQAFDGFSDTKYLNFGKENSGLIVTPIFGSSTVRSMVFTTPNDAPERDPASWELYGTNDTILSTDNSDGMGGESWSLIGSGDASLPNTRLTVGPVYSFVNEASYASYRLVFPTLKSAALANSMQIADIGIYESTDGSGENVLNLLDEGLAIDLDGFGTDSAYPDIEPPSNALDGNVFTKYLNFGRENSGFIVTPSVGSSVIDSFQVSTANDFESRDPTSWELYGTNSPILSMDNSTGDAEPWTLIDSGVLDLPVERFTPGDVVPVNNSTTYASYRMVFPTIRDPDAAMTDSLQFSEVQFFGESMGSLRGDFNNDGVWNLADIDALVDEIAAQSNGASFDMNGDGLVNQDDLTDPDSGWLKVGGEQNIAQTDGNPFLEGDANLDGVVDVSDFNQWNNNKFTNVAAWSAGDFSANGSVDVSDFNLWNGNKFQSSSSNGFAVVPEPSGLASIVLFLALAPVAQAASCSPGIFAKRIFQPGSAWHHRRAPLLRRHR